MIGTVSVFEVLMLACFGFAWPFSLRRSWTARSNNGKSVVFLYVIAAGYVSGVTHKLLYQPDMVIWLYAGNLLMVAADILIYYRNIGLESTEACAS